MIRSGLLLASSSLFLAAGLGCSSEDGGSGGSSGTGGGSVGAGGSSGAAGTGGSSGAAGTGGSSGAAGTGGSFGPPAQGGLTISVGPPFAGGVCPSTGFNAIIALGDGPRHRNRDPGDRVIDGQDDASVSCRVAGSSSFSFSGSLERLSSRFSVTPTTIANGGASTVQATMFFPDIADVITSSEPCTISVATAPLEVAPGRIWATIECPNLVVENQPDGRACGARGEFVFENCEQQ